MFHNFGNRLKRDLKHLVDRRLDISALNSGSSMKVGHGYFMKNVTEAKRHMCSHLAWRLRLFRTNVNGMNSLSSSSYELI